MFLLEHLGLLTDESPSHWWYGLFGKSLLCCSLTPGTCFPKIVSGLLFSTLAGANSKLPACASILVLSRDLACFLSAFSEFTSLSAIVIHHRVIHQRDTLPWG